MLYLMFKAFIQLIHHAFAANEKWRTLVQFGWHNIQEPFFTIGSPPASHFCNKCKRIGLIQQTQFAFRFINSTGIHEDAALDKVAVHIGHHTAYITLRIRAAGIFVLLLTNIYVFLYRLFVLKEITMVY